MSNSSRHDVATTLLRKSASDEQVVARLVGDSEIDDEAIGFHAQQAIEKAFKAVLTARDVRYSRINDLAFLIDLLQDNNIEVPFDRDAVEDLTPYADRFRYEDPRTTGELARQLVLELVCAVRVWAANLLGN